MSKKIKVGLIGSGMIANAAHLPAYRNRNDRYEIAAVADIRAEAARETAARFNASKIYEDPQKMLNEMDLDIVSVCTPNNYHKQWSIAALRAGFNVACEKPIAVTYKDAVEMYTEAEKAKKHLFITQTQRFSDEILSAKRIIDTGRMGEPYYAQLEIIRRRGIPTWGFFHMKEHNFGGPFCDLGVHWLDSFLYLTGNPKVKSVHGKAWTKIADTQEDIETSLAESGALDGTFTPRPYDYKEFNVEDMTSGIINFENDLQAQFKFSWAVNIPNCEQMYIAGTKAGIQVFPLKVFANVDRFQSEIIPHKIVRKNADVPFYGHWRLMEHIIDVLDGKCEAIVKKEEVLNNVSAIEAFYLSASQDRDVSVTDLAGYAAGK